MIRFPEAAQFIHAETAPIARVAPSLFIKIANVALGSALGIDDQADQPEDGDTAANAECGQRCNHGRDG
jgi:hypothetical protein